MDATTTIMFAFTFIIPFVFYILGFSELREIFRGKEKGLAAPAMGTIYFFICFLFWLALGMWWPAMATDAALATLGWVWYAFALLSFSFVVTCIGFILYHAVQKPQESKLEIQEERRYEGYER
jgi:hypothetical protein